MENNNTHADLFEEAADFFELPAHYHIVKVTQTQKDPLFYVIQLEREGDASGLPPCLVLDAHALMSWRRTQGKITAITGVVPLKNGPHVRDSWHELWNRLQRTAEVAA